MKILCLVGALVLASCSTQPSNTVPDDLPVRVTSTQLNAESSDDIATLEASVELTDEPTPLSTAVPTGTAIVEVKTGGIMYVEQSDQNVLKVIGGNFENFPFIHDVYFKTTPPLWPSFDVQDGQIAYVKSYNDLSASVVVFADGRSIETEPFAWGVRGISWLDTSTVLFAANQAIYSLDVNTQTIAIYTNVWTSQNATLLDVGDLGVLFASHLHTTSPHDDLFIFDDKQVTQITNTPNHGELSASFHEEEIVYSARDAKGEYYQIWTRDPNGESTLIFPELRGNQINPHYNENGDLVFAFKPIGLDEDFDIYTYTNGELTQQTYNDVDDVNPMWIN